MFKYKIGRPELPALPAEGGRDKFRKPNNFYMSAPVVDEKMACSRKDLFDLSPSQLFWGKHFTPKNPSKYMLFNQGAGSGKTCLAVNIMDNFLGDWEIVWVTRRSLRNVPEKEIYGNICLQRIRDQIINSDKPFVVPSTGHVLASTRTEKIKFIQGKSESAKTNLRNQYSVRFQEYRNITYDDFVKLLVKQNGTLWEKQEDRDKNDFGKKTLFIVDEAHNLISNSLSVTEREWLDTKLESFELQGKKWNTRQDIYGPLPGIAPDDPIQGRDTIAAMLHQSYHKSGKDSAKIIFLTATPILSSPIELCWMMNLGLQRNFLPLSVPHMVDSQTLELNSIFVKHLKRVLRGHVSYLDPQKDPSQFAHKIFAGVKNTMAYGFQRQWIEDINQKQHDYNGTDIVPVLQNIEIAPKVRGTVMSDSVLSEFEAQVKDLDNWNPAEERKRQETYYKDHVQEARKVFKFVIKDDQHAKYEKARRHYDDWAKKNKRWKEKLDLEQTSVQNAKTPKGTMKLPPSMGYDIRSILDDNYQLLTFQGWLSRQNAQVAEAARTLNTTLDKRTLKPDIYVKYKQLVDDLRVYRVLMADWEDDRKNRYLYAKKQRYKDLKDIDSKPDIPKELEPLLDRGGQLLSVEQWYENIYAYKKHRADKEFKKQTKLERIYWPFLIKDPASGKMRLKTKHEYVQVDKSITLKPPSETDKISFLMWQKGYDRNKIKRLLPFYAPKIHEAIQQIYKLEKEAHKRYGRGYKYAVFTFSGATKGPWSYFGTPFVASCFEAYNDFNVLTTYKKGRNTHLIYPDNNDKWGVGMLSSKSIPNPKTHLGGKDQLDYTSRSIPEATTKAFNAPDNIHGERMKVIILDQGYMEGVDLADVDVGIMLHQGLTVKQLEQATSRMVRRCKSQHLPFYVGMGAMVKFYYFNMMRNNNESVYDKAISFLEPVIKTEINMIETFDTILKDVAVDRDLNEALHSYSSKMKGIIDGPYEDYKRAYVISTVQTEAKTKQQHTLQFITDPNDILEPFKGPYQKGQTVVFRISNGVSMAQKVMNIAGYKQLSAAPELEKVTKTDLKLTLPKKPLEVLVTSMRGDNDSLLLALAGLFYVLKGSGVKTPLYTPLPNTKKNNLEPFTLDWECRDRERLLTFRPEIMSEWLNVKNGLSFVWLKLHQRFCDKTDTRPEDYHMNLLVYNPKWGVVERFDPLGHEPHTFDTDLLDAKLYDMFQIYNPEIKYISLAETSPTFALQRLQVMEQKRHDIGDPNSFSQAFGFFYLQMRILHMTQHINADHFLYPLQFHKKLVYQLEKDHPGEVTNYIRNYAQLLMRVEKVILTEWSGLNPQQAFWQNVTRFIQDEKQNIEIHNMPSLKYVKKEGFFSRLSKWVRNKL